MDSFYGVFISFLTAVSRYMLVEKEQRKHSAKPHRWKVCHTGFKTVWGWVNKWYFCLKWTILWIENIWTCCTLYCLKWSCHSFITVKAPKEGHRLILDVLIFWKNVWISFFLLIFLFFSQAGLKFTSQSKQVGLMYPTMHESRPDPTFFIDQLSTDLYS